MPSHHAWVPIRVAQHDGETPEQYQRRRAEIERIVTGFRMGRYAEAEPLYKRGVAIFEKSLGAHHPSVASALDNLASVYKDEGRYAEAEPLYKQALAIREKALPPDHPDVAQSRKNLADLDSAQGR